MLPINIPKSRKAPRVNETRPEAILAAMEDKRRLIDMQQAKADAGEFADNYGAAIGLQRLRMDHAALRGMLPGLTLVETNDNG